MVSGSDRACEKWLADYAIPGTAGLVLHHLYRAMAWLGEELPPDQQAGATPFAPRMVKDLVEERLFARRRDLFSELSVVFLDTTSLSFAGEGGETLGERGHSKDHRPDLMQMILGVVVDAEGRPVCSEMWPGNTADVGVLVPVIDRLRSRFAIGRVCVVADRGMISAPTIAALEARGLEYVLGARERTDALVREAVRARTAGPSPRSASRAPAARRPSSSSRRSPRRAGATSSAATRPRRRRRPPTAGRWSKPSTDSSGAATRR
jgi:Transposase DDE domain